MSGVPRARDNIRFVALILAARLAARLPIPGRWRRPVVKALGARAFLLALTAPRIPLRDERPTDA